MHFSLADLCFEFAKGSSGSGPVTVADIDRFQAHMTEVVAVYRKVVADPPGRLSAEEALRAVASVRSYRILKHSSVPEELDALVVKRHEVLSSAGAVSLGDLKAMALAVRRRFGAGAELGGSVKLAAAILDRLFPARPASAGAEQERAADSGRVHDLVPGVAWEPAPSINAVAEALRAVGRGGVVVVWARDATPMENGEAGEVTLYVHLGADAGQVRIALVDVRARQQVEALAEREFMTHPSQGLRWADTGLETQMIVLDASGRPVGTVEVPVFPESAAPKTVTGADRGWMSDGSRHKENKPGISVQAFLEAPRVIEGEVRGGGSKFDASVTNSEIMHDNFTAPDRNSDREASTPEDLDAIRMPPDSRHSLFASADDVPRSAVSGTPETASRGVRVTDTTQSEPSPLDESQVAHSLAETAVAAASSADATLNGAAAAADVRGNAVGEGRDAVSFRQEPALVPTPVSRELPPESTHAAAEAALHWPEETDSAQRIPTRRGFRAETTADEGFADLRNLARPAFLRTEWFDPSTSGVSAEGLLAGAEASVRAEVRRFQIADGTWIIDFTLRVALVPQANLSDTDTQWLARLLSAAVDEHYNRPFYRLPNGDRLHLTVVFLRMTDATLDEEEGLHHVVKVHAKDGSTTTTDFYLGNTDESRLQVQQVLHEFGHMAFGLRDRYPDSDMLFRRTEEAFAVREAGSSVMAHGRLTGPLLGTEELSYIQTVIESGPVIYDLPHPSTRAIPPKASLASPAKRTAPPIPATHRPPLADTKNHSGSIRYSPAAPFWPWGRKHKSQEIPTSEEQHVRGIGQLIFENPVNLGKLLLEVELWSSGPALYLPSSLEETFARVWGKSLLDSIYQAAQEKRLPWHALRDVLAGMGLSSNEAFGNFQSLRHIAPPPGGSASEAVEVTNYALAVRAAFAGRDFDGVMGRLLAIRRDLYIKQAVGDAWLRMYGTDMRQDLTRAFPDRSVQIDHALGSVAYSRPVSRAQAQAWFDQLTQTTFDHPIFGPTSVTASHPEDGCYLRAHFWAAKLIQWGVKAQKVFIANSQETLWVLSNKAEQATERMPRWVNWNYHVAPVISTDEGPVVMDLALADGPLTIEQWARSAGAKGKYNYVAGSLPEVHLRFLRETIENPTAWQDANGWAMPAHTTVVLTDSYALDFPSPNVRQPSSWEETDGIVRQIQDRMIGYNVLAEQRSFARRVWATLYATAASDSPNVVLERLRDLVAKQSSVPGIIDFLHQNRYLNKVLNRMLGPQYGQFMELLPGAVRDFMPTANPTAPSSVVTGTASSAQRVHTASLAPRQHEHTRATNQPDSFADGKLVTPTLPPTTRAGARVGSEHKPRPLPTPPSVARPLPKPPTETLREPARPQPQEPRPTPAPLHWNQASRERVPVPVPGSWSATETMFILDPDLLSPVSSLLAEQVTAVRRILADRYPAERTTSQGAVPRVGFAATSREETVRLMPRTMAFASDLAKRLGSVRVVLPNGQTITVCENVGP
ncbi:protein-glutamine glutaminase family protein [Streptomyces sp. NPDC008061]|uniref:protein-glutamine glutaminase family protein n=1 Tax=Streptomyces sp. NPDC008061 TaxID=3364805 RepID=UPI0036ED6185